ncbi:predicted protein [Botrytis cinerea T4]|uniref:Uncharacterized protein n=1 Tax=Botryotinia fuckeliana (strain T4) TaxID=999810 RepID=G2Y4Y8_BOTF4|nr:predicted protein [Botrytis cinerea T4]
MIGGRGVNTKNQSRPLRQMLLKTCCARRKEEVQYG